MRGWLSLNARVLAPELPGELEGALRLSWEKELSGVGAGLPQRVFSVSRGQLPEVPAQATAGVWPIMERPTPAHWHRNELWLQDGLYLKVSAEGAELVWERHLPPPPPEAWMLALTEAHRAGGWLPLHAAAIAGANELAAGGAVAMTGQSGAGKSTATLRLSALGSRVLAEDRTFWHAPSGLVAGLDRYLRAFDDSLERFAPHLLTEPCQRDGKGKRLLPLPEGGAAPLRALLLLGPAQTLGGAERVRALWDTTGLPLTALGREQVQAGVQKLLPLFAAQTVTRETVIPTVQRLLTDPPDS